MCKKNIDEPIVLVYYTDSTLVQTNRRSVDMQYDSKISIYLQVFDSLKIYIINDLI